ncbi:MAG TPA: GTP-sensing pleiotropic transcriptional regulator CodY [Methylomusa anaerophila]|uniref:Global transcriptional regulator CodY n=1 Tax=Methylomusa anaerophila TaxID=1930071 RepID=A0A348AQ45_9FIRM|nr:GTP-sensing pleiotropic transcriptional regulator CodY [Methylomusa anaerophila]BBB93193.1 GTP-sensing transcriptional pleiotropic repressor CodY [Methylomusa anaerophila]HML86975.1 GTP-sensing pleiotropic transcriptional regulator CodY [Methylomusa anaerophila]
MSLLLERTRAINKLLQKSENVEYGEISHVLSDVMAANVYIVNKDGTILGYALLDDFECDVMKDKVLQKGLFPERYVEWLLKIDQTSPNLPLEAGECTFSSGVQCLFNDKFTTIVPIHGVGERIATLIVAKFHNQFTDDDLILAEYGATVVGMEILRDRSGKIEEEARKKATVQVALGTLSYSELEAVMHILSELEGNEGLLVASKIADRVGITRSVIVNALRKFESAGVIESKSLGMKGTYIKVLNERLLDELKKLKNNNK